MNNNPVSHSLPADWESTESHFHGVSKSMRLRGYVVSLLLNHRQYQFGPFKVSQLEAANAYDALLKYFLPYTKSKPAPNCPAESFFKLTDAEAEEKCGADRLQRLRKKFREELDAAGLDVENEMAVRVDHVLKACNLRSNRVVSHTDRRRRRALVQLEAIQLRGLKMTSTIVANLQQMSLNKEQRNQIETILRTTLEAQTNFSECLVALIQDTKSAIGLDPNTSTPAEL